jgi:hypothetical protein
MPTRDGFQKHTTSGSGGGGKRKRQSAQQFDTVMSAVTEVVSGVGGVFGADIQSQADIRSEAQARKYAQQLELEKLSAAGQTAEAQALQTQMLVETLASGKNQAAPAPASGAEEKDDKTLLYVGGAVLGVLALGGLALAASK